MNDKQEETGVATQGSHLPVPAEYMQHAAKAAIATRKIVEATALRIQGRGYVRVEGWQAIALAHGCVASACNVERIERGVRAIGEVRRLSDGVVVATAEGFVGDDEKMWQQRPEYARRAMAQTRAVSRACRSAFAHVVVLMNAGLETVPAEEIPDDRTTATPPRPGAEAADPSVITEPQRKRFFAICKKRNDFADVKQWLQARYPYCQGQSEKIRRDDYEAICARMMQAAPLVDDTVSPPADDIPETWPEPGAAG